MKPSRAKVLGVVAALAITSCDLELEQDLGFVIDAAGVVETTPEVQFEDEPSPDAPEPTEEEATPTETESRAPASPVRRPTRPVQEPVAQPTQQPTKEPVVQPSDPPSPTAAEEPTQEPTTENLPPQPRADSATTGQADAVLIDVLANDSDPEGDRLTITDSGKPQNGSSSMVGGKIQYVPNPDFTGTDRFSYAVYDGHTPARADITVVVVNGAPVAVADRYSVSANTSSELNVSANDSDPDGDSWRVEITVGANHGTVGVTGGTRVNYYYDYDPTAYKVCQTADAFSYRIIDEHGLASESVRVNISINC